MLNDYQSLTIGVVLAGVGGELFLRGMVGCARQLRVSGAVIGATVAAFGTSSPEFFVAVSSALAGDPGISLGDALGSNVVNVALILGLALMIASIPASRQLVRREFSSALLAPLILGMMAADGLVSRIDGTILLIMFLGWLIFVVIEAREQRRKSSPPEGNRAGGITVAAGLGGLGCLMAGGHLIVEGAHGIAVKMGLSDFAIGATIVAAGTSVPELATTVIAQLHGRRDISLGTILGSNLFNGLWVIGAAAIICPIGTAGGETLIALVAGVVTVLLILPSKAERISRIRGVSLLVVYVCYVAMILSQ